VNQEEVKDEARQQDEGRKRGKSDGIFRTPDSVGKREWAKVSTLFKSIWRFKQLEVKHIARPVLNHASCDLESARF
jgi:hypothetical protein